MIRGLCEIGFVWYFFPVTRQTTWSPLNRQHICCILKDMTGAQFKRWLEKRGCTFEPGKGGHLTVRLGANVTSLPMHGAGKEIGKGLEHHIKKVLGLK